MTIKSRQFGYAKGKIQLSKDFDVPLDIFKRLYLMAYLLDTHTFLWFVAGDKQLPESVKAKIKDINEECFLSITSLWEITIKYKIGKLTLGISLEELFDYPDRNKIGLLQISNEHLLTLSKLPEHHSDPFDRLIVSQALTENLPLITKDKGLKKYKIKLQWG